MATDTIERKRSIYFSADLIHRWDAWLLAQPRSNTISLSAICQDAVRAFLEEFADAEVTGEQHA